MAAGDMCLVEGAGVAGSWGGAYGDVGRNAQREGRKTRGLTLFRTSRWRPQKVDKRMVLEYTHGLFIT